MDKVIHIGAGTAVDLDGYLAAGAKEIVLVEPLPAEAHSLRQLLAGPKYVEHNIKVLELAVATELQADQLFEYNAPSTASLRQATGLKALFPGLKILAQHTVDTVSPEQFIQTYKPAEDETALLVVQAPGEACSIVKALIEADLLKCFRHLCFTANPEPFYAGSKAADVVLSLLKQQGFELLETNEQDPDWPSYVMQRSPLKDTIEQLEIQLKQSQQVLATEQKTHQDKASALKTQLQQSQQQHTEFEQQLVDQKKQLDTKAAELQKMQDQHAQAAKQLEQARKALASEQQTSKQAQDALTAEQQAHAETVKSLEDHKLWFRNRKQQAETLEVEKSELKRTLDELQKSQQTSQKSNEQLKKENQSLQQQLEVLQQEKQQLLQGQQHSETAVTQLEQRMTQMFEQQAGLLQQSVSALGQHVTRSFNDQRQHLQTLSSLNTYLETGLQPLLFGGWAIDADLANYLVRKLELESYDLVIEFGSGTSTQLIARVLGQKTGSTDKVSLEYDGAVSSQQVKSLDLPQRILSFEQDKTHFDNTRALLAKEGLSHLVDLVLAPLVPTPLTGQQVTPAPLFYSCEQNIARIAQVFEGRSARILVLVDGPFSPQKDPLVREPALAMLLQHLSAHQLEFLLDDYQREGEQQVAEHWQQLCEQRGLAYKQESLNTEKGALWVTINP